ncbi:hypothetical protein L1887_23566 [Cichorium endivia]|nr:hypothetical protein L1887_23566 [Cichorium endivia]
MKNVDNVNQKVDEEVNVNKKVDEDESDDVDKDIGEESVNVMVDKVIEDETKVANEKVVKNNNSGDVPPEYEQDRQFWNESSMLPIFEVGTDESVEKSINDHVKHVLGQAHGKS